MKRKVTLVNNSEAWDANRRYKINAVVSHSGSDWQNATGINSEPGVGTDWVKIDVGGSQTLQQVSDTGGLSNGSTLKQGTTDAGNGGAKGIALKCSLDYEFKWEAGRLYVIEQDGFTIREVSHNFGNTPTLFDDNTKGFVVGSRWLLDNGDLYVCTSASTGGATWDLQSNGVPTLQQVLDYNHDLVDDNNFQGTLAGDANTGVYVIAFGREAAKNSAAVDLNAIGSAAGRYSSGQFINAFGNTAAEGNTGSHVNAMDRNAAYTNVGNYVNAIGENAANENLGEDVNAFGREAAFANSGNNVNGIGQSSVYLNSGDNVNGFGYAAANQSTGSNVNAFGYTAGFLNGFKNINLFGFEAQADADNQTVFSKWISGATKYLGRLSFNNITADQKWELPDNSGTVALISDLPKTVDNFANDTLAAAGGIGIGKLYHTSGVVKIRLT